MLFIGLFTLISGRETFAAYPSPGLLYGQNIYTNGPIGDPYAGISWGTTDHNSGTSIPLILIECYGINFLIL